MSRVSKALVLGYRFAGRNYCNEHVLSSETVSALARPIFRKDLTQPNVVCEDCLQFEEQYLQEVRENV